MDYNNENINNDTEPVQHTETVTQQAEPVVQRTQTVTQNAEPVVQRTQTVTQRTEPVVHHTEPVSQQTQSVKTHTENLGGRNIVSAFFGLVEILIGFRFLFKLFGANTGSGFVQFINGATGFFVNLFKGIFAEVSFGDNAVFEPASILAMIIVALIAWFVFKLMTPKSEKHTDQTSYTSNNGMNQR
ncbi:MAG: hypothetical protein ACYC5K_07320 [Saccharofermentanales bacterium]